MPSGGASGIGGLHVQEDGFVVKWHKWREEHLRLRFERAGRQKVGQGSLGIRDVLPSHKSHDSNLLSGRRLALQERPDLSSALSGGDKQSWSTLEGELDSCLTCWCPPKQVTDPQRQKKIHPGEFLLDFTSCLTAVLRDASNLLWKNKQLRSIEPQTFY